MTDFNPNLSEKEIETILHELKEIQASLHHVLFNSPSFHVLMTEQEKLKQKLYGK